VESFLILNAAGGESLDDFGPSAHWRSHVAEHVQVSFAVA
jgi:hypothetical protein